MYKARKITPQVYGFVKANLNNGVSYEKTIKLLFKTYKVKLGNTSLVQISKSWDFDDYCSNNINKRKSNKCVDVCENDCDEHFSIGTLLMMCIPLIFAILFLVYTLLYIK